MRVRHGAFARSLALAAAFVILSAGSSAIAAETCAWTRTPSGADFGTCDASSGKTYCVTCQFAPRVCVRTPC
jgi:hypothetical protein